MKRKIMIIGIMFILIVESVFIYNLFKPNKSQILQDIKIVDIFDNKDKTLSIMIQQDNFDYKEDTSRTIWPSKEEYLYVGSKCTDANGTDLGDTTKYISFEETSPNPTVTIKTKKTIYCTMYFAKGRPALEVLKAKGGDYYAGGGDHTSIVDGMYRFKGTNGQVTNNYICLGTSENPDVCKTNKENMYRIIGVTTDGKLKVIKAVPLSNTLQWSTEEYGGYWTNNPIYKYLNETFYNSIDSRIKELIVNYTWNLEKYPGYSYPNNGPVLWPNENPTSSSISAGTSTAFVGLMYATDFPNAGPSNANSNWLFIKNGWSGNASSSEWTMTNYGQHDYGTDSGWFYFSWYINPTSSAYSAFGLGSSSLTSKYVVRPVFYLSLNAGLIGSGTTTQPYTVTTIK